MHLPHLTDDELLQFARSKLTLVSFLNIGNEADYMKYYVVSVPKRP